jgi:hypothetical protein
VEGYNNVGNSWTRIAREYVTTRDASQVKYYYDKWSKLYQP